MKRQLNTEIFLGSCPCGIKKVVEKERKDYNKRLKKFLKKKVKKCKEQGVKVSIP